MQKSPTIGIVGGGIAGLISAYYLSQKVALSKTPHIRILLFERSSRFGGWIQSKQLDKNYNSHIFEHGPRTLRLHSGIAALNKHSAINTIKLFQQLNIFDDQACLIEKTSSAYKNRLIYYNKNLINTNDISPIFGGKPLRYPPIVYFLYEYFAEKGHLTVQDETVKSFIYRRFGDILGEDIVEYILDPLLKGIYGGNVANLSARSIFKNIFNLEQRHGSIIRGFLQSRKDAQKQNPVHFLFNDLNLNDHKDLLNKYAIYYLQNGMETIVKTLVKHLQTLPNVELMTNKTIKQIQFSDDNIELTTLTNDKYNINHLISAMPAFELANYFDQPEHEILRKRLNQIPFVNMIVVNLLFEKEDIFPKVAFGYLIPSRENSHLLGVLFDSCVRHKTDKQKRGSHLTVMMGGAWFDQLRLGQCTDEQLLHIVLQELKQQMNLNEKPWHYVISRLNRAIPNYHVGHENILDDIYALIRRYKLPLTLVGHSYRGIGVSDVIYDARLEIEYLNLENISK